MSHHHLATTGQDHPNLLELQLNRLCLSPPERLRFAEKPTAPRESLSFGKEFNDLGRSRQARRT
jgi:hypothetical protein